MDIVKHSLAHFMSIIVMLMACSLTVNAEEGKEFKDLSKAGDVWEGQLTWPSFAPRHVNWTVWVTATDNEGAAIDSEKITVFLD